MGTHSRIGSIVFGSLLLLLPAAEGGAQVPDSSSANLDPPGARRVTATVGTGNSLGWFGGQGEWYFRGDRLSAFGGLGYNREVDGRSPSGPAYALGLRGFTDGANHRGFLELSYSLVLTRSTAAVIQDGGSSRLQVEGDELYGPGVQVGYQYAADGGFTVLLSAGAGYGIGDDGSDIAGIGGIGLGYTWR